MNKNETQNNKTERPPVVVIMGHIDHGKSTLLDYIRKTNVVERETGGITQRISAYEVVHPDDKGAEKRITFIDTPGHASFSGMRERGAQIADIAILIVSAEDGVKPQTLEAWKTILENKIPAIVAINKIDKPNANIEKTKIGLTENNILIESYGGQIPSVEISAKDGTGVNELLSLINLVSEVESFTGNPDTSARGFFLETHMDSRRGIEATLIIKDGTLKKGDYIAGAGTSSSTNMLENFKGENIEEASFSSPVRLAGFSNLPEIGGEFLTFSDRKEAEEWAEKNKSQTETLNLEAEGGITLLPLILKADIAGSLEAIEKELKNIKSENAEFRVIQKGVGKISEGDVKNITGDDVTVVGFNVKVDKSAQAIAEKRGITLECFNIIYKLTEWLQEELERKRPKIETEETTGVAKILKVFSQTKQSQLVGGKVQSGRIVVDKNVKILRRENEIGKGRIVNLQKGKDKTSQIEEGTEFGMMIESKIELAPGDRIESFNITKK